MSKQTLTPEQTAKRNAALKEWNRDLFATIGKIALVFLAICCFVWIRSEVADKPNTPNTIKVVSVDYERHTYAAMRRVVGVGIVEFTAHCADGVYCPSELGRFNAGPESMWHHPDLISQHVVNKGDR